jgi:hypothetical protein
VNRLLLFLAASGFAGASFAQSPAPKPALEGIVFDPIEAGITGARVTLRRSGSAASVIVMSYGTGAFRFEGVSQGTYTIAAGLRYDWQSYFHDNHPFAPRASLAYSPGKSRKIVIPGGAGFFYDRTGPQPIFDLLRYNGYQLLQYVINNPPCPIPAPWAQPASCVSTRR